MIRPLQLVRLSSLAAVTGLLLATPSYAAIVPLEQFEFQGQPGTETTLAPSLIAPNLAGINFNESAGLTPSGGLNSINTSGWNTPGQFYSVGFNVNAGFTATVNQITLTSRSSGTGPGSISVLASVDGGALKLVGSITQTSTNYNDEFLAITPVTATKSVIFYFEAANQTSAAGAAIGSGGTFRIGDYNPTGGPLTPFTLSGSVTQAGTPASVPEPASLALVAIGIAGIAVARHARGRLA